MDINASPLHSSTLASSQLAKSQENNEPAVETKADNDQDDKSKVSTGTVNLSAASIKLSVSSPVHSSDQIAPIANKAQAQQVLSQVIADFQSNPSQALGAHGKAFTGAMKSLLG